MAIMPVVSGNPIARIARHTSMRFQAAAVGSALALALASCGASVACTLIGCSSGANVDLSALPLQPGPKSRVTVCVDHHCASRSPETLPLVGAHADAPYGNEQVVTVSISLIGPDGTVLARSSVQAQLRRIQPNGPKCGPICYTANLRLTASGQLVPA